MNANSLKTVLSSTISISDLTSAGAKKIFDSLNKDEPRIVLKNNKPVAALVSIKRYQELLDKEEDLQLIQMALSRKNENQSTISREQFLKNNGIDENYLNDLPDIECEKKRDEIEAAEKQVSNDDINQIKFISSEEQGKCKLTLGRFIDIIYLGGIFL